MLRLVFERAAFQSLRMSKHLESLERQYPGQIILNPEQVAKVLGAARQTVYNQHSNKTFPIRPIYQGRTWGCSVVDIAHFLDTGVPQLQIDLAKPRAGRKTSQRQVLKYQFFGEDKVWTETVNCERKPTQKQILKYQAFWDDVIERMDRMEQKPNDITHVLVPYIRRLS